MSSIVSNETFSEKQIHELPFNTLSLETEDGRTLTLHNDFKSPTIHLNQNITQSQYAKKRKFVASIPWLVTTSAATQIYVQVITFSWLKQFIPLEKLAAFHSFVLKFDIQPSTNFLWQGKALLIYDPSVGNWFTNIGRTVGLKERFQQNHIEISAGVRDTVFFTVPMVFPFKFFMAKRDFGKANNFDAQYLEEYPLGTLRLYTVTNLLSTVGQPQLNLNLNISIEEHSSAGNVAAYTTIT